MKKIKSVLLVIAMVFSMLNVITPIHAVTNENIARNKTVTVSSTYPDKPWTADKITDGVIDDTTTKNSRWSSKRLGSGTPANQYDPNVEQWVMIDLGQKYNVSQINVFWEGAYASTYKLQGSMDGVNFFDIKDVIGDGAGMKKYKDFDNVETQYVRVLCQSAKNNSWGYSIYEVEVFQYKDAENASDVADLVENIPATISSNGTKVVLPEVPEGYDISIFGTDNEQVVTKDGNIIKPLIDMPVNLMYKIVNKNDANDTGISSVDALLVIPGEYSMEAQDNAKPNVMPGLREWKGATGEFTLTDASKIVCESADQKEAALMIQSYFKDMLERPIDITVGTPAAGDVYVTDGSSVDSVGKEGYYLLIDDYVTIKAPTYKGMIYGGASITQILYQDEGWNHAPKGISRDYPQYSTRAGMIDVGRMFIPMEYLQEMTTYMSWFKMNEAHIHINDYWGGSGYSAFRLESKVYPQINAEDGYYTQEAYKDFQKDMKKYGMDIVTEIDTPYHSEVFRKVPGSVMLGSGSLDISTDEAFAANQEIIENLFDEYLDGDDPVFQSNKVHIGGDEYNKKYSEQMRKWVDHFVNYINDKGCETRQWGSIASNGYNGVTPVSSKATVNAWAAYAADVKETYDAGYNVINTDGGWLYIVPAGNAGYPDRYDTKKIYEQFEVNYFNSARNGGAPHGAIMPAAHPQTKGASFAIWNDMTSFKTGFSWFDVYDRMKDAVSIISEKTWFGEDETDQSYTQFRARIDALQNKVPNVNPGRFIETKGSDVIADYDIMTATTTLKDKTNNHYDATVTNGKLVAGKLSFDGDGYVSMPMKSAGYPYSVSLTMSLKEINENTTLFAGEDGTVFADLNGKVGYKRGAYAFNFDYTLKANQEVNLIFVGDQKNVTLYVNGKKIGTGKLTNTTIGGKVQQSSTLALPVERIFEHTKGTISEFTLYNRALTEEEIHDMVKYVPRENLALGKTATASALEVNDGRFTAAMAVDGIVSSASRVSFARSNEQWLLVDLGKEQEIGGVGINYESSVGKYEIQVSNNGTDFTTVYTKNEDKIIGPTPAFEKITFEPTTARYVRYVQKEMWHHTNNSDYSGSIYEFEIYKPLKSELLESVAAVEAELNKYEHGSHNGQLDEAYYASVIAMLNEYKALANSADLSEAGLESAKTVLAKELDNIASHILFVKQEAINALDNLKAMDGNMYTSLSYAAFKEKVTELEALINTLNNYEAVNEFIKKADAAKSLLVKRASAATIKSLEDAYVELKALRDEYNSAEFAEAEETLTEVKAILDKGAENISEDEANNARLLIETTKGNLQHNIMLKALRILVAQADAILASDEINNAQPGKVEALQAARDAAKALIDVNCSDEAEINASVDLLDKAIQELYQIVNKDELKKLVEDAGNLEKDIYTLDSWKAVEDAMAVAETVIANEDATESDVQNAYDALFEAISKLTIVVDKAELQDQLEIANKLLENKDKYVASTVNYLQEAVKEATAIFNKANATQQEVNAAVEKLVKGIANLKKIEEVQENGEDQENGSVNSGDSTRIAGSFMFLIISAAAMIFMKKRKNQLNK